MQQREKTMIKEKELIEYVDTKKKVVLYGAGMVGGLVKCRLESNHLESKILCFVKSVVSGPDTYMGLDVISLDSMGGMDEDIAILVCALPVTQNEMVHELELRSFYEYRLISKELFLDLQKNYLREQQILNPGVRSQKFDVIFFSQDNNFTSGAFISMAGLCDEIQKKTGIKILVVLPRYGDGETLLKKYHLEYTYVNRETEWIREVQTGKECADETCSIYCADEVRRLRTLIRDTGARLVHISGMFVFAGAIAAKEEGVSVIWHIRENIATQGNGFINKKASYALLNSSYAVVCVSQHVCQAYPGLEHSIVRVIYNGADDEKFFEKRNIFTSSITKIVMVGHITPLKGQEILIRALEYLKSKHNELPYVTFVGGGDPKYLDELKKMVVNAGLENNVVFAGRTLEPENYYRQSDIAVSATSGGEGFDRVRIEAMLAGCLLIANDLGAAREIVEDGESGYLYENGSAVSLASVIRNAMKSIHRSRKIAMFGQKLCMEKFTKKYNADQVLALYREVMGIDYGKSAGIPGEF